MCLCVLGVYVWACHNLTILILTSCWLKNVTNNSKIAKKKSTREHVDLKRGNPPLILAPCSVAMLPRPFGPPIFKNPGSVPACYYPRGDT